MSVKAESASIRYNNPGAMWGKGNPIATRFGAKKTVGLNDGLKQNNNIAVFPDMIHGAAAQFALWDHGYTSRTLAAAISKWSGGNSSLEYMKFLTKQTGLKTSSPITRALLEGPTGIELLKAQAQWEAGKPYPMTDADWATAQAMAFGAPLPTTTGA